MAITIRKGLKTDFDPTKMVRGEFAFCYDTGEVYLCVSPGVVIKLGTADAIAEEVENAEAYALGTRDGSPVGSTDPTYNNNAKHWADAAAAVVGIGIATTTTAGIVKPDGTTITVAPDGTIHHRAASVVGEKLILY